MMREDKSSKIFQVGRNKLRKYCRRHSFGSLTQIDLQITELEVIKTCRDICCCQRNAYSEEMQTMKAWNIVLAFVTSIF